MKVARLLFVSPQFHCFCGGCMQNYLDTMHTPEQILSPGSWVRNYSRVTP